MQAIQEMISTAPIKYENLVMFNLCDQLPGGDLILEALSNVLTSKELDRDNSPRSRYGMYSVSSLAMVSNLGFGFGSSSNEGGLVLGEIAVGGLTLLEEAVKESKNSYKKVVVAQATVDGVKVEGIDTNMAVMKVLLEQTCISSILLVQFILKKKSKISVLLVYHAFINFVLFVCSINDRVVSCLQELLLPLREIGNCLLHLVFWDEPWKSTIFCLIVSYIIFRYISAAIVLFHL